LTHPPWALLVVLLVGVSLAVYGLARWEPFAPEAPAAAQAPPGDAARGEAAFAQACAGCHGAGAEGGIGPALAGSGVGAGEVLAVVAAGRGAMPAGLVTGQEAADVAAYVAGVSGGDTGTATTPAAPEAPGGRAVFTGEDASGVSVRLDEGAPAAWTVWIEGPAGRRAVATIPAGRRAATVASVDGASLLGRYDAVLVGADPAAPALAGELAPGRADDLRLLLDSDPTRPGGASALDAAAGQIDVLHDHVRFLVIARDEGNLANVRFHGEHIANIALGRPARDLDGNGDPSNPGDGLGLIDGRDAHLPRISSLAGPAVAPAVRDLSALVALIAAQAQVCGTTGSVDDARPAIAAIERADARVAAAWARVRARAERAAVIELEPR
jgi:mono/diheme cytochrome c family protein